MAIEEFASALPPSGALLGLDVGAKTIGLSVSDSSRKLALPLKTLKRTRLAADMDVLKIIINERKIAGLILGLPLNMDGTEGPQAQSVRTFASNLRKALALPIGFWDERLTTHEAGNVLMRAALSRKKDDGKLDASAATIILQGALDRLNA